MYWRFMRINYLEFLGNRYDKINAFINFVK